METRHAVIHGRRIGYRAAGAGPPIVLIHGMAGSSETWEPVIASLSERASVIALDLLGHGSSDKPSGDYSLGALASGVRDLLVTLGHERATVVGHSLGGGVAMQFAYQFPEHIERLVLVSSGGLGREVNRLLRALAIPGAEYVLAAACSGRARRASETVGGWLARIGMRAQPGGSDVWRSYVSLGDRSTRAAFVDTLRAVVGPGGQKVGAHDRLYLAAAMPTLIVWGDRDPFIPVAHARDAHAAIPGSRLEIFPEAGHYPHRDDPARFARLVAEFVASTEPARLSAAALRGMIAGPNS